MKNSYEIPSLPQRLSTFLRSSIVKTLCCVALFIACMSNEAEASHFRYGNISWSSGTNDTIIFKVTISYRYTAFNTGVGQVVYDDYFYFGDGSYVYLPITVTSVNTSEDFFIGESTVKHKYVAAATYTAYYSSCCRIGTLQNNAGSSYQFQSVVQVGGANNNSPVCTSTPIINVSSGQAATTFQLAAADPDGQAISYRFSTSSENASNSQPTGMSVSTTGLVTFNTIGKNVGELYNASFTVTDALGATTPVDVIVRIVNATTPPTFDYAITPANGYVYDVQPGTAINFTVKAQDVDAGDNVTLNAVGLPTGASLSPTLPASGNPVSTSFSWTPTASQLGSRIVSFVAQDNSGTQSTTSITIIVGFNPVFNVPPTPVANSVLCIKPGLSYTSTIEAQSPDTEATVRITAATALTGVSYSPAIPTTAGNVTSTTMSWTPTASQFGPHTFTFTATDNTAHTKTHSFELVVNSMPAFTSSPVLVATIGVPYTYTITVDDPDVAYGDDMDIAATSLPAWLTVTHVAGSLTATLTGTPTAADLGANSIRLLAEDTYHHCYGHTDQEFTITVSEPVIVCNTTVGGRLYVDTSVTGGNGATWACAFKHLYDAVNYANYNASITEIWIAKGTYTPLDNGNRSNKFDLARGDLKIIGGFNNGATLESEADPITNPTIISGDVGVVGDASDNSYNLFYIHNMYYSSTPLLLLKGLILEKANGNSGGAIMMEYVNNTRLENCVLRQNTVTGAGGAIYLDNSALVVIGCTLENNTASSGGGVFGFQASPTFRKTIFKANTAVAGGAFYGNYGTPIFRDVVFTSNTAQYGGATYHNVMNADYINTIFHNNHADHQGAAVYVHNGKAASLLNCTLYGNSTNGVDGDGGTVFAGYNGGTVKAYNTIFWKNTRGGNNAAARADYQSGGGNPPTFRNCMLQENSIVDVDNGITILNNIRGIEPAFINPTNAIGADGKWYTPDDGLQLTCSLIPAIIEPEICGAGVNSGDNGVVTLNSLTEDILGNPRIVCFIVERGAYELQACNTSTYTQLATTVDKPVTLAMVSEGKTALVANPFSTQLQVKYVGAEKASIAIVSATGKVMTQKSNLSAGTHSFDASMWSKGLYNVVIVSETGKKRGFKAIKL